MLAALTALLYEAIASRLRIDAWMLGDLALVAIPAELFVLLGREIENASAGKTLLGYANGYSGYLADRAAHRSGTYEALASPFGPEASERVAATAAETRCPAAIGATWPRGRRAERDPGSLVNVDVTANLSADLQPELSQPFAIRGRLAIGDTFESGGGCRRGRPRRRNATRAARRPTANIIDEPIVAPGLIDLRWSMGLRVRDRHGSDGAVGTPRRFPERASTSSPTLISSTAATYRGAFADLAAVLRHARGARALGLYLEGPFLSQTWKARIR